MYFCNNNNNKDIRQIYFALRYKALTASVNWISLRVYKYKELQVQVNAKNCLKAFKDINRPIVVIVDRVLTTLRQNRQAIIARWPCQTRFFVLPYRYQDELQPYTIAEIIWYCLRTLNLRYGQRLKGKHVEARSNIRGCLIVRGTEWILIVLSKLRHPT